MRTALAVAFLLAAGQARADSSVTRTRTVTELAPGSGRSATRTRRTPSRRATPR